MDNKREFVYEISKCSDQMLHSWTRHDLLQILYAQVGKHNNKRYNTLPKTKIITMLFSNMPNGPQPNTQTTSKRRRSSTPNNHTTSKRQRKTDNHSQLGSEPPPPNTQTTSKRQRKCENPLRLPVENPIHCPNVACRATLCKVGSFCKFCSCYICYNYDYNKDPSLWLFCSQEPSYQADSCGMSCHLECAIRHVQPVPNDEPHAKLDVGYLCASCGKMNNLLKCLRNQLLTANDTTKVEVLCYRLSISEKLLRGTKKYQYIHDLVNEGVRKLEAQVGPLSDISMDKREGLVSGLSSGVEVQKMCASASKWLESVMCCGGTLHPVSDSKVQDSNLTNFIRFEYVSPTSTTVVLGFTETSIAEWYSLWHRRADAEDYTAEPTCVLFTPRLKFTFFDLTPASEYLLKVVSFCNMKEETWEVRFMTNCDSLGKHFWVVERDPSPSTTNSNSLSNPPSDGDESNNLDSCKDKVDDFCHMLDSSKLPSDDVNKGMRSTATSQEEETPRNSVSAVTDECIAEEVTNTPVAAQGVEIVPFEYASEDTTRPSSPCDLDESAEKEGWRSKADSREIQKSFWNELQQCARVRAAEEDYVHCVKVIRSLECKRYIEKNFREKLLSWYSLRATGEEKMKVKEVMDTLKDEPISLSRKLIETFAEQIFSKRSPRATVSSEFCMKMWH